MSSEADRLWLAARRDARAIAKAKTLGPREQTRALWLARSLLGLSGELAAEGYPRGWLQAKWTTATKRAFVASVAVATDVCASPPTKARMRALVRGVLAADRACGGRTNPAEPPGLVARARAHALYRITHWGAGPRKGWELLECAEPSSGPLVALGELVSVTYRTVKASDGCPPEGCEYTHDFSGKMPLLAFSIDGKRLVVAGGSYRVGARGIVG